MDRVRFCTKKTTRLASGFLSGCQKSPRTFPTACKNAVTFPPRSGGKVLAALAERLAVQGIRGIRSHSRRAAAPSSSPAKTDASSTQQRFFDKLRSRRPTCRRLLYEQVIIPLSMYSRGPAAPSAPSRGGAPSPAQYPGSSWCLPRGCRVPTPTNHLHWGRHSVRN